MATLSSTRKRIGIFVVSAVLLIAVAAVVWIAIASAQSSEADGAPESALADGTAMGVIELTVDDLEAMRAYYVDAVGLEVLNEADDEVLLGFETPLICLTAGSDGEPSSTPTDAGLYHSAILYDDAPALAEVLMRIATVAPDTFQGSADHAVSEAFYFVDPEGNGLELYVDRPRDEWVWEDGEVQMGSDMLDPNAFIEEHLGGNTDGGVEVGHVHLKVGDLGEAEAFYVDALGFAVTARADGAVFYAADGYHHDLATNVWQSAGAAERVNPTGLGSFEVTVPASAELDAIAERLDGAGFTHVRDGGEIVTSDPWGNEVRIAVA